MLKEVSDLHAGKKEFISRISNRRNIYLEYDFISNDKDLSLVFIEKQVVQGRKLTSLGTEERAKVFQSLLEKHQIDVAIGDLKVLLVVKDNFEKSYGYQWDNADFSVNEYIKKLDHDECGAILKQLEL